MSHADEMDEAIDELRRRFRLERVRDCCISVYHCGSFMHDQSCIRTNSLCVIKTICLYNTKTNSLCVINPSLSLYLPLLSLQGTAADRFFGSLSNFIQGMDTKNIVKVSEHMQCTESPVTQQHVYPCKKKIKNPSRLETSENKKKVQKLAG